MTTARRAPRLASPSRTDDTGERGRYFAALTLERPDVALCRATTVIARAVDEQLTGAALTVPQHLVLKMLAAVGACSQQELSEQLRIDRSVMVGCVDGLENAGLVVRERHPRDRRAYAVTMTDAGAEALAEAEAGIAPVMDRVFSALTPEERQTLARLTRKILDVQPPD
ncbi:MarR family winged helix-turn-helix transcriptional regulator [Kitasatospora sp. NPDC101183]|uniref:MarR family winged helix-turn-helix transcriptional regulator n=1 Tax=Kitasatospora sp. NPDC101183 TaxID=3364100 RepID=UPI0037FAFE4D